MTSIIHLQVVVGKSLKMTHFTQMDTLVLLWGLDLWSPSFSWLSSTQLVKLGSYVFKICASNQHTINIVHLSQPLVNSRLHLWFTKHILVISQSKTKLLGLRARQSYWDWTLQLKFIFLSRGLKYDCLFYSNLKAQNFATNSNKLILLPTKQDIILW